MKIKDFEERIQKEIDSELTIRTNPNAKDIAGVYYKEHFIGVSVPPEEIFEEISATRVDALGVPYKTIDFAFGLITGKLAHIKRALEEDPDLFKD
jgi:hypothetical protein